MTAHEILKDLRDRGMILPYCCMKPEHKGKPSNSELFRWLSDRAVIINGLRPLPNDEIPNNDGDGIKFTELVFFPQGDRKTTYF